MYHTSNYSADEKIADLQVFPCMQVTAAQRRPTRASQTGDQRRIAQGLMALFQHLWTYDRGGGFLQAIEESRLSLTQVKALVALDAEQAGPCPIRQLAEELGITPPTATRAIDALVERDLVSRIEDPDDRRVRRIAITEAGHRLVGELASRRTAELEAFAEGLNGSQRRKLITALEALLESEDFAVAHERVRRSARG
jgi:DNA-binding MarR family transcriptional regulator